MQTKPPHDPLSELVAKHHPKRIKFDYTMAGAAYDLHLPISWLWYWAWSGWLRPQSWMGRWDWIHLQDVENVMVKPQALEEAARYTGERIPISTELWESLKPSLRKATVPVELPEEPNLDTNDLSVECMNAELEVSK